MSIKKYCVQINKYKDFALYYNIGIKKMKLKKSKTIAVARRLNNAMYYKKLYAICCYMYKNLI